MNGLKKAQKAAAVTITLGGCLIGPPLTTYLATGSFRAVAEQILPEELITLTVANCIVRRGNRAAILRRQTEVCELG